MGATERRPTLASVKDLRGIREDPPDPTEVTTGCPFLSRCTQAVTDCAVGRPPLVTPTGEAGDRIVACIRGGLVPILRARGLRKASRVGGTLRPSTVHAVDGVDLDVRR